MNLTWQDCHEVNPDLFPLPLELRQAKHPGAIGVLLRKVPLELVKDANRCRNPWLDLASMRFIADFRSVFLSCTSILPAWNLLATFGWGGATGAKQGSSLSARMQNALVRGDIPEARRIEKKIVDAMFRADPTLAAQLAVKAGDINLQALSVLRKSVRRPIQFLNREQAKDRLMQAYPIQILLVSNWIRSGAYGDPGWLFYSNHALASLLTHLFGPDISSESVEQICVRLGLRKPRPQFLYFSDAIRDEISGVIRLNHFLRRKGRFEFPKDGWRLRSPLRLGRRVLYGGISSASP